MITDPPNLANASIHLPSWTDNIGFSAVFWLLAGLNIVTLPILWALFRAAPEVATRKESAAPA